MVNYETGDTVDSKEETQLPLCYWSPGERKKDNSKKRECRCREGEEYVEHYF